MLGLIFPCALAIVDQVSGRGGLVELESGVFLEVGRGQLPIWTNEGDAVSFRISTQPYPPRRFWRVGWISTFFTWGHCGPRNPGVLYEFEESTS
jgi:hypothetical protein